jgi:hypothetical protein
VAIRHRTLALLTASTLAAGTLGITSATLVSNASAASKPIFTVMNTSETLPDGVWFRNSPHTGDTNRVTGLGVYMNERVQLECYAWGDAVGPYNDTLWYYVLDVTRPTNDGAPNMGFLNAHYINDGKLANQIDANVPACVNNRPPTQQTSQPNSQSTSVTLAQGPVAPSGYRYAITLSGFAANTPVTISCRDSADPGGFYTFSLTTNSNGQASTQSYCYSGDGPDHWVVANGIESNHVTWAGTSQTGTAPSSAGGTTPNSPSGHHGSGSTPVSQASGPSSVFYSGTDTPTGVPGIIVADLNLGYSDWAIGNCQPGGAIVFKGSNVNALAAWSKGRLGVIYFLAAAGAQRIAQVHRIILFDPGSTADFTATSIWDRITGVVACDQQYDINALLANWLRSNPANHLIVLTGKDSEQKNSQGQSKFNGLWKYYFAGIWNQPFANRAQVCDYDLMAHQDVLRNFAYIVKQHTVSCPPGPKLTAWNP